MAVCKVKQRTHKRVCIGSLNHKIEIYVRSIKAPAKGSVDFSDNFTLKKKVWAMVDTVSGETRFNASNIEMVVTHHFYIRYIPNVDIVDVILHGGLRYKIVNVENLNNENYFLVIKASDRGDATLPVNEF
jgi:SPP1 family predicted phage head-tail adaptor